MDFISARVTDGRWFRILTVVDQFARECLSWFADQSLTGEKMAQASETIITSAERLAQSRWITGANSPVASWLSKPIVMEFSWILFAQGSRSKMGSSRVSIGDYELSF